MLSDQAKCSTDRSLAKLNIKNERKKIKYLFGKRQKKRKNSAKKIGEKENDEKIEKCK